MFYGLLCVEFCLNIVADVGALIGPKDKLRKSDIPSETTPLVEKDAFVDSFTTTDTNVSYSI